MPDEERPEDERTPSAERPGDETPSGETPAADAPPPLDLSPRRPPLRGTGSGIGMAGDRGGTAGILRRVQEAAEVARRAAEQHRPAAERAVREAAERAKQAAEAAKPEAERLTRQARAAAEAARPHLERAAGEAANFAREHEDDLRKAALGAARNVAPQPLRPAIDAMREELKQHPAADEGRPPEGPPKPPSP